MYVIERPKIAPPPETTFARRRHAAASLAPFAALGLYAVLRWGTMLQPDPYGRLLGMLGLSLAVAALGLAPHLPRRRSLAFGVGLLGLLVIIPLSGLPLSWITHVRIAVTVRAIGQGLSALPNVLVPYAGINEPVRAVIVMGAGVLLLDGAMMLAFAPRSLRELRPAAAALPLVVLAVVPSALSRPGVPYLNGVLLFLLLAAMVWGERAGQVAGGAAAGIVALAAIGALIASPIVDPRHAWIDFQKLTTRLGAGRGEQFNWSQTYGPLSFPRHGHEVLEVQARIKSYWKAEDLDVFDGRGWVAQPVENGTPLLGGVSRASLKRWTQTLHVTVTGMRSDQVIAAGVTAQPPAHLEGGPLPGAGEGTWLPEYPLHPGDSYTATSYTPQPTPAQLQGAGESYPPGIADVFLTIELPASAGGQSASATLPVTFGSFHSLTPVQPLQNGAGENAAATAGLVEGSPYGPAYALARGLAQQSATPYDFALAVKRYLQSHETYNEDPPPSRYPIEEFLFTSHRGYCQQFAGAMALLLRMGGVPARVAAGFTSGTYQSAGHDYAVSDIDAHAWVEAWFPGYGWVTFDPTPGQDPALSGKVPPATPTTSTGDFPSHSALPRTHAAAPATATHRSGAGGSSASHGRHGGGGIAWTAAVVALALAAVIVLLLRWTWLARAASADPVAELERAFGRGGRPLTPGTTLCALEHRFREDPDTAAYIHALRIERYGATPAAAGGVRRRAGRRALRAQLAVGRKPFGHLRALWALPPALPPAPPRRRRRGPYTERADG